MANLNPHLEKLSSYYFFQDIEERAKALKAKDPQAILLNLGIGDITKPLTPHLLSTLCSSSQEMGDKNTFHGYGPSQGYPFLREAILYGEYRDLGISADEIFISSGAKGDLAHLQELFSAESRIGVTDPAYPVFLDANVMAGRTLAWSPEEERYGGIVTIPCLEENGFSPLPPDVPCDLIYLCSPNNPTGTALTRKELRAWVDYALKHRAVLLFDGAYEAYISSENCPHSIYEIEGAREVAIEIRSFSKSAGFTGLRCSYSVIPKSLFASLNGKETSLHSFWKRRQDMKFGSVPYPIQKCAAAIYSPEGRKEVNERLKTYREQARFLLNGLKNLGLTAYGGIDAPYIWCKTPGNKSSWDFFNHLLQEAHVICIPGKGFGKSGEGFVRFSSFADPQILAEGLLRIKGCVYPNQFKNWPPERVKAPGFDDRK